MIDTTGKCSACGQTVGIDTIHTCSPQVTAPTQGLSPAERRVGEEWLVRYADPNDPLGGDPVRRDLAADLLDLRRNVEGRRVHCAYCGEDIIDLRNPVSSLAVQEHVVACPKHPIKALEAQVAALTDVVEQSTQTVDAMFEKNQRLTAEVERLTKLAYIGEHHFPDLTWKARCEEAAAEVERLRGALVKVRAHTAHTKASPDELHIGLLASIERIADAALSLPTPAPEEGE